MPAPRALASLAGRQCAFAFIASPAFANIVNPNWYDIPLAIFEVALSVVLLVKRPARTIPGGDTRWR
ncbi:MAG TPA: hypothetical protein VFC19_32200 [Candidatus Limnocylindrales bacterium]|nr:hypothetical protein [Candidatus Limnocylindrales bacterium]